MEIKLTRKLKPFLDPGNHLAGFQIHKYTFAGVPNRIDLQKAAFVESVPTVFQLKSVVVHRAHNMPVAADKAFFGQRRACVRAACMTGIYLILKSDQT